MTDPDSEEVEHRSSRHRRHRRHRREYDEGISIGGLGRGLVMLLFLLLLVLAPLPMGANRDWAWSPIVVAIGAIAVLCAVFGGGRGGFSLAAEERGPFLWLLGTFVLFLLIAILQMSPLAPAAGSAWLYARARELLGQAHAPVPTIAIDGSFYTLLRCMACPLLFLVARALCRDERSGRQLMQALLVSAIIVAAYGMYMQVTTHNCFVGSFIKKEYGYQSNDRCLMSGTFVSPNNFACYLGMAVVAALALLFGSPSRRESGRGDEFEDDGRITWLTGSNLALAAVAVLCMGGILISGSRAGFAATVAGVVALGYLLVRGRKVGTGVPLRWIVLIGVVAILVVGLIAGGSLLRKAAFSSNNFDRVLIWKSSLQAVAQSPLLGWGLGSYADVYAMNQPPTIILPNDKAHSTPIELLVELGIPGGIVAILLGLIPWWVSLRAALRRHHQRYLPAAAFAVAAVPILHSTVDFSLQIPAISFMASAFLGLGWAQAFPHHRYEDERFTEES